MTEVFQDRRSGRTYADAREMVNDYVRRFGEEIRVAIPPLDGTGYVAVRRGSATVGVNVLEDSGVLLLLSRLMPVPAKDPTQCFRRLLELSFLTTHDAAFAIDEKTSTICVRAMRRLSALDYEEFEDLLGTVATVADQWDDELKRAYGV